MEEERSRLADLIEKHAISYSNEPFTLASGAKSNFYFDLRQVSGDAEGITAIARLLYNMITEIGGIKSVGGLESGSISLAAAISQYSYTKNPSSPLTSFYVRKQAKSHGAKKRIAAASDIDPDSRPPTDFIPPISVIILYKRRAIAVMPSASPLT